MKKKNILITGFDGFLGSNLLKKIDLNKYCIYGIGYTRKKLNKNFFLNRKITYKNLSFFKKKNISIIIHCAGSSMVGLNYQNDFKKNVLTTYEILEFSKSLKKKPKIIIMSSMAVYGDKYKKKIKENFDLNPFSFYGLNKKICEEICIYYSKKFKINIFVLRVASLFGVGLKKQFIYQVTKKLRNGVFKFWGKGDERRDYIHINDLCNIVKILLKKKFLGFKVINCGSGNIYSISEIIKKILFILGIKKVKLKFTRLGINENPKYLIPDLSFLNYFCKYKTNRNFNDDLKEFILSQKK